MANNVNANIVVDIDTAKAQANLRALQSQVAALNKTMGAASLQNMAGQQSIVKQTTTSVTRLDNALAGVSRSAKESFKTAGQAIRGNGDAMLLAQKRAQGLNATYKQLGGPAGGLMAYNKQLGAAATNQQVMAQRMVILNRALNQGSTAMLNYGKNLQWAGRQMMVGFTVPLTILAGVAAKTFMDLERQIVNFKRVYGDFDTTTTETKAMTEAIEQQAISFAKWGITVRDSIELAASAAATGLTGDDLLNVTEQATKLATLGMITQEQALDTMISLNSAFQINGQELEDTVNFLNAVENQTVLALSDVTEAIPLVAPVIKGLGGDVQDLAVMLTAMREGGIGANEAANALKTSLARLVTPAKAARDRAEELGINLKALVEENQGDLMGMINDLARAMQGLGDLQKQQLLSDLFGKRQFARMGALFSNIADEASQAQRVIDLTTASTAELAALAEKELGDIEESAGIRFTKAMEQLKVAIAPIGEAFLKILTPIIEFGTKAANWFNSLEDGTKTLITAIVAIGGAVVPVGVMLAGLALNFTSFIVKTAAALQGFLSKVQTSATSMEYLNQEQMEAALAADKLSAAENSVTAALNAQAQAVANLGKQYTALAGQRGGSAGAGKPPIKMATGGKVPGTGNTDKIPALLTPGEFVVKKSQADQHRGFLSALNNGTVQGFNQGTPTAQIAVGNQVVVVRAELGRGTESLIQKQFERSRASGVSAENMQIAADKIVKASGDLVITTSMWKDGMAKQWGSQGPHTQQPRANAAHTGKSKLLDPDEFASLPADALTEQGKKMQAAVIDLVEVFGAQAVRLEQLNDSVMHQIEGLNMATREGGSIPMAVAQDTMTPEMWQKDRELKQKQFLNWSESQELDEIQTSEGLAAVDVACDALQESFMSADGSMELVEDANLALAKNSDLTGDQILVMGDLVEAANAPLRDASVVFDKFIADVSELGTNVRATIVDPKAQKAIREGKVPGITKVGDTVTTGGSGKLERAKTVPAMNVSSGNAATNYQRLGRQQTPHAKIAGIQDGEEYLAARQSITEKKDIFLDTRDRQSPHPQASIDGTDDGRAYVEARNSAIEGQDSYEASPVKNGGARSVPPQTMATPGMQGMSGAFGTINAKMAAASQQQVAATRTVVAAQNRFANITNIASAAMTKVAASAKTFGLALKNGSMKISGATGALTGVVFAASMIEGPLQEMAQQIMPATFALMALQQLAPLLMNPIGLMVAAVVGVTAGLWYLNKKAQEAAQAAQDFAINSQGSARALKNFAEGLGKIDPQAEWAKVTAGVTEDQEENFGKAMDYVKSESGQEMVERAKSLSGEARVEAMLAELRLAIATGLIDKDTARSISQALSVELKDPALGQALVKGVTSFGADNQDKQYMQTKAVLEDINSTMLTQGKIMDENVVAQERLDELRQKELAGTISGDEVSEQIDLEYAAASGERVALTQNSIASSAGELINTTTKLSQIQASANLAYREGALDLEEYNSISADVAAKQNELAESLAFLQEKVADDRFSEQIFKAAEALGMTEEQIKEVKTQTEALNSALEESYDSKVAQRITDNITAGLLSGDIDKGLAGSALDILTSGKNEYKVYVDMIEENPEATTSVLKLLNTLEMLPPRYRTEFEMTVAKGPDHLASPGMTVEEQIALAEKMRVAASYFLEDATLSAQAYDAVMDGVMGTDAVARTEAFFNSINNSSEGAMSGLNLEELNEVSKFFEDNENLEKDTKVTFAATENGKPVVLKDYIKAADISWKEFAALPDIQKQIILTAIVNLDVLNEQMSALRSKSNSMFSAGELSGVANQWSATMDAIESAKAVGENAANTPTGGSSGGGGNKENDWLEQLLEDTKESKVLYGKLIDEEKAKSVGKLGWIEWLRRNTDLTEEAIQELAKDEKARQKYAKMSKGEREKVDKKSAYNQYRETRDDVRAKEKKQAEDTFITQELGNTLVAEQIKKNEELTKLYMMGGKHKERALDLAKRIVDVEMTASEKLKWQNQQLEKQEKLLMKNLQVVKMQSEAAAESAAEAVVGKSQEAMQEQNVTLQAEADYIRKSQIDPIQDKIEAQQKIIDGIEREAELLERGLEIYDDQLETKQKQVEEMQRADEIMMRESEMLDHDMKLMGYQEEAINKTYEERIASLDKVAQLNQQIANQQKDQLGLADALSRGDVSAAAAAAQQMQQNQMQFAGDQFRSQLETSRDSQLASLTGAESGMTREQIEERKRQLEEQSYYNNLNIRDIEDQIYNIEQLRAGKQAEINTLLDTTRQYEDKIFELEGDILDIEEARLAEIEKIVTKNEEDLALINKKTTAASEGHRVAIAQETERQAMAKATRDLDVMALEMQESLGQSIEDNIRLMNAFGTAAAGANRAIKTGKYTPVEAKNAVLSKEVIDDYKARIASVPANITATGTAPTFSVPTTAVSSGAVGGIMGNITNNYNNSNVNVMAQGADANQVADIVIQKLELRKNSNIGGQ